MAAAGVGCDGGGSDGTVAVRAVAAEYYYRCTVATEYYFRCSTTAPRGISKGGCRVVCLLYPEQAQICLSSMMQDKSTCTVTHFIATD